MTTQAPVLFIWDGEAMHPASRNQASRCDEQFIIGQKYILIEQHERSTRAHNYYFASVNEAFNNLPEDMTERFPSPEHLRKYALIKCGYFDSRSIVASSKAEACRLSAFIQPLDEFSIVIAREATVTIYTAKSQSTKAMGGKEFAASKQAVLEFLSSLIGVPPQQITQNAKEVA